MSETVERVAKAIVAKINEQSGFNCVTWDEGDEQDREEARDIARAAIEAMRTPTASMIAHAGIVKGGSYHQAYCDMIDGALK